MYMGHNFSSDTTPKNEVFWSGLKFGWLEFYLMIPPTKKFQLIVTIFEKNQNLTSIFENQK